MIKDIGKKLGKKIGEGKGRKVYEYKKNSRYVVKVHKAGVVGCNWREWYIWNYYPEYKKWLAPCKAISKCGNMLLQVRGKKARKRPANYPSVFHDLAKSNWVVIKDRIVMCDYANLHMFRKVTGRNYEKTEEEKIRAEDVNREYAAKIRRASELQKSSKRRR